MAPSSSRAPLGGRLFLFFLLALAAAPAARAQAADTAAAPVTATPPTAADTTAPSTLRPEATAADSAGAAPALSLDVPRVVLRGIPFTVTVKGETPLRAGELDDVRVFVNGRAVAAEAGEEEGAAVLTAADVRVPDGPVAVEVRRGRASVASAEARVLPGWLSILPPLLAIVVALLFRQVVAALFLGIFVGAWTLNGFSLLGLWTGLLDTFQVYVLQAIVDEGHAAILLFSLMIGGMVGIISKNGGMQGVVNHLVKWANTPKRGQVATWALGILIFFDDYANSLIIGNTMRPVTDRLRVSREKLAFIVDATSAPVASLALVTTWIGFEVGLINEALGAIPDLTMDGYSVFLESILFRFYPILMLFFVLMIALTDREFGPMHAAEERARTTGKVLGDGAKVDEVAAEGKELAPPEGKPHRALNAILPVLVLVVGVVWGLFATGEGSTMRDVIGSADSYKALMWASLASVLAAVALTVGQRILTLDQTMEAWYSGLKAMLFAMIILLLAWGLSALTDQLHTGAFLGSALSGTVAPGLIPFLVFVLAAIISFATGTSWGTMGILMPLVVPVTWQVMGANDIADPAHLFILYSAVSSVLAGSVWGDHCSPISDTTILSSMASGCDHIEHVRTQLPYALIVGVVGLVLGTLPTGFGVPWWVCMPVAAAVLGLALRFLGKPVSEPSFDPSVPVPLPDVDALD